MLRPRPRRSNRNKTRKRRTQAASLTTDEVEVQRKRPKGHDHKGRRGASPQSTQHTGRYKTRPAHKRRGDEVELTRWHPAARRITTGHIYTQMRKDDNNTKHLAGVRPRVNAVKEPAWRTCARSRTPRRRASWGTSRSRSKQAAAAGFQVVQRGGWGTLIEHVRSTELLDGHEMVHETHGAMRHVGWAKHCWSTQGRRQVDAEWSTSGLARRNSGAELDRRRSAEASPRAPRGEVLGRQRPRLRFRMHGGLTARGLRERRV